MRPDQAVKSAKRALEVAELLEKLQRPAGVNEIATLLGYPQSSTSVLLSGLRNLGYLQYDVASRSYALSLRVALIGSGLRFAGEPTSQLYELVRHVRDETQLATAIATRNEVNLQYVFTTTGAQSGLFVYEPGKLLPLLRTASGYALLSTMSESDLGKIVRRINAGLPDEPPVVLDTTLRTIERFRTSGYIRIVDRVVPGFGSIALRLPFDDTVSAPLALSVGGPSTILAASEQKLVETMAEALVRFGWTAPAFPEVAQEPAGLPSG